MPNNSMSAKDLSELGDLLTYEYAAVKKCAEYAQEFTDPGLCEMAQKLASHHYKRFSSLLSFMAKQ